ncbi:unnamed protein product [Brassicogethes aeneus]|uniref:receptor protein-tyrosine kinase n=1 Tax=Brassicogethes aeneus TaxID=1431903 RepID=A0A9P0AT26_BRAAE|nr:unnamed protein product [Brassicogethes aeneus]
MYFKFVVCFSVVIPIVLGKVELSLDKSEYVLEKGGNLDIYCYGTEPIQWDIPKNSDNFTKINTKSLPGDKTHSYVALLEIKNISYLYVGSYKCLGQNENKSIYLYVKDLDHLYTYDKDMVDVYPKRGSEYVLPCKPTFPEVKVTLYDSTKERYITLGKLDDKEALYTAHPHHGIYSNASEDSAFIDCTFEYTDKYSSYLVVLVHVEGPGEHFIKLTPHTNISITVEIEAHPQANISWKLPKNFDGQEGETKKYDIVNNMTHTTLFLKDVEIVDTGFYTVKATNMYQDEKSLDFYVNVTVSEDYFLSNNSSVQPDWRSNYKGDYKGNVKPLCTKDLICWAFQVSRGMEYLASRKVLHGDLAARNILLSENNVVKICDFGLAKSMYNNDNYQKKGEDLLPIRWMAIEYIRDHIFSTQSDVWSFGVVLWEFFSLSRSPYPGILPDKTLYDKLASGYRMEKPEFAPKEIHNMMMDCWLEKPQSRPSFEILTERLGNLLEENVARECKLEATIWRWSALQTLICFPRRCWTTIQTLPIWTRWVICSPGTENGQIFVFPDHQPPKNTLNENGTVFEKEPMMSPGNQVPNSVSNHGYHLPLNVEDNYVNMPQNKQDKNDVIIDFKDNVVIPIVLGKVKLSIDKSEYVFEKGGNLDIKCSGTEPIHWDIPKNSIQLGKLDDKDTLYTAHPHHGIYSNASEDSGFLDCTFEYTYINNYSSYLVVHVNVEEPIYYLPTPIVRDLNFSHVEIGQKLVLECELEIENQVKMFWILPNNTKIKGPMRSENEHKLKIMELIVNPTAKRDIGNYTCLVEDLQNHTVTSSIPIKLFSNDLSLVKPHTNISITVEIDAHPQANISWKPPKNVARQEGETKKYDIVNNMTHTTLILKDVEIVDTGFYTVTATNMYQDEKSMDFYVNVTDIPIVEILTDDFHLINENSTVICRVAANPPPNIEWFYKDCDSCDFKPINKSINTNRDYIYNSTVTIKRSKDGLLKCIASNNVKNGFEFAGLDDFYVDNKNVYLALHEKISLMCGASVKNYSKPEWYVNSTLVEKGFGNGTFDLNKAKTNYSSKIYLKKEKAEYTDSGNYECKVEKHGNQIKNIYYDFSVMNKSPLKVVLNQTTVKLNGTHPITLTCDVFGLPKPKAVWLKGGQEIKSTKEILFSNGVPYTRLNITVFKEGTYECSGTLGVTISKEKYVELESKIASWNKVLFICLGVLLAILIVVLAIALKIFKSKKKLEYEMKQAGLDNFKCGAIENLNPNLAIDEQADLLPYDDKFEFPLENLKMGKQLGSGAFGVVMKAVARHIMDHEDMSVVAVKMVKKNADPALIKALASELKIMVHLGKHLNVLNLLGACTKNVAKRELMVIVEFCRYGNLHNYIQRHRDNFINQIDPNTQSADFRIGLEVLERVYSAPNSPAVKYAELSFQNPRRYTGSSQGSRNYSVNYSARTQMSSLSNNSEPSEEFFLSNNSSIQPDWRSNYKGDYKGNVKPICTKDLICWAFQVSRGMEYLASRKVLHGDLAARNILLSENNIVKICDFGLAKSMYNNDNYQKKGEALLPIRWMAIESIRDRIFSTQSDVWSFGVVLWEFFSLSRSPYPGILPDKTLYDKLASGYRMEKPEFAPKEIHNMMMDCWLEKPQNRPSFENLTKGLGDLLEDKVRRHYIDLNDPYLKMNTETLDTRSDYLAMVSPPDFGVLSSPLSDDCPNSPDLDSLGYLSMRSADIFSPRIKDGQIFDFADPQSRSTLNEKGSQFEMEPMMSPRDEVSDSFSNPSYHLPPKVGEIARTADNYVNMPQNKHDMKNEKKDTDKDVAVEYKEMPNYVNDSSRDWEGGRA